MLVLPELIFGAVAADVAGLFLRERKSVAEDMVASGFGEWDPIITSIRPSLGSIAVNS